MISNTMTVARQFITAPLKTGAVAPASTELADAMVQAADLSTRKLVVELGPGTGAVTEAITRMLSPGTEFFALELNSRFARETRRRCPGVTVHVDDALNLPGHLRASGTTHCDAILSSLPWTLFSRELQQDLVNAIADSLVPGGRFVTYAYIGAGLNPAGRRFKKLMEDTFTTTSRSYLVWNNLPPAHVYTGTI